MFKLYNTQATISSDLSNYFKKVCPYISKPHLKLISPIILGMIESESVVTTDIVKKLKGDFSFVNPFSTVRRLERFFNNSKFDIYHFYNSIITCTLKTNLLFYFFLFASVNKAFLYGFVALKVITILMLLKLLLLKMVFYMFIIFSKIKIVN